MTVHNVSLLTDWHPVFVEGMGGYDPRDPQRVAEQVCTRLSTHWQHQPVDRPKLLITQGDPLEPRGISAITRAVAERLSLGRGLICLDEHIADYHARDADRHGVILEFRYSQLLEALPETEILAPLEAAIDQALERKNHKREQLGKPPLKSYYRDFARLQEVSKVACRQLAGSITVAHTSEDIHEFSVTSFYTIGLELGLTTASELVGFRP
ncbi:hypothetical protein SPISAL_02010 [Spiribacter salinus M19-40]|uniref:Shikimate kinase n=1 Tax=Spiribacter salinus M19-40 TaxID=1260251 RepID=R4VDV4_9GAMM|nr:hypothetical protein [Spiribacter salinus]AGM40501.1 hypothetical protein SPISAL_02010 [Spiribacter salinus M19-40]